MVLGRGARESYHIGMNSSFYRHGAHSSVGIIVTPPLTAPDQVALTKFINTMVLRSIKPGLDDDQLLFYYITWEHMMSSEERFLDKIRDMMKSMGYDQMAWQVDDKERVLVRFYREDG